MKRLDLDRLTMSQRKLAAATAIVVWALFAVAVFGPCDRAGSAGEPGSIDAPLVTSEPGAFDLTEAHEGEWNGSIRVRPSAIRRARQVAVDFVEAYASYSFEDDSTSVARRVEPFASASLVAELRTNSGAGAFYEDLAARRERAEAEVEGIQTQSLSTDSVEFLVIAKRTIRSSAGRRVERPTFIVMVTNTRDGWNVTGLTL